MVDVVDLAILRVEGPGAVDQQQPGASTGDPGRSSSDKLEMLTPPRVMTREYKLVA